MSFFDGMERKLLEFAKRNFKELESHYKLCFSSPTSFILYVCDVDIVGFMVIEVVNTSKLLKNPKKSKFLNNKSIAQVLLFFTGRKFQNLRIGKLLFDRCILLLNLSE